jgi:hypothetical protein
MGPSLAGVRQVRSFVRAHVLRHGGADEAKEALPDSDWPEQPNHDKL